MTSILDSIAKKTSCSHCFSHGASLSFSRMIFTLVHVHNISEMDICCVLYVLIVLSCLVQLSAGKKDHEICSIFAIEENASLLLETGYEKPLHTLTLQDIGDIRAAMTDYHCMIKVKAAMDQFLEGLEMGGVAGYLKTNPDLFRPLLQHIPQEIDTGKL